MSRVLKLFVVAWCASETYGLLCYNCSTTHEETAPCGGDFSPLSRPFNDTFKYLVNCTADNSMCFVRSWRSRAKYAWIVQRGCYEPRGHNDSLVRLLKVPTRAMTCTNRKLIEADYKVCLCKADWCNLASSNVPYQYLPLFVSFISSILYLFPF